MLVLMRIIMYRMVKTQLYILTIAAYSVNQSNQNCRHGYLKLCAFIDMILKNLDLQLGLQ